MKINGATLMMTVEHTDRSPIADSFKDAVNVWMEYDNTTMESYVCLREMQNFDGVHKGIHVVCCEVFRRMLQTYWLTMVTQRSKNRC